MNFAITERIYSKIHHASRVRPLLKSPDYNNARRRRQEARTHAEARESARGRGLTRGVELSGCE